MWVFLLKGDRAPLSHLKKRQVRFYFFLLRSSVKHTTIASSFCWCHKRQLCASISIRLFLPQWSMSGNDEVVVLIDVADDDVVVGV